MRDLSARGIGVLALCLALTGGSAALAQNLITSADIVDNSIRSGDIRDGTIKKKDLSAGSIAALEGSKGLRGTKGTTGASGHVGLQGLPGLTGAKGDAGATGLQGPPGTSGAVAAIGARGPQGDTGAAGAAGAAGENGANPGVAVIADGDHGWGFIGSPSASLTGGELLLAGGFDGSTIAGGIGMAKAYQSVSLSTLTNLSYGYHVNFRPAGNVEAPSIHVSVIDAIRDDANESGFTNLVFTPAYNGGDINRYVIDAIHGGKWFSTRPIAGGASQASPMTIQSIVTANPDAKIVSISLDNGGTSGAGTTPVDAISAGADNLVVGFDGTFVRYDFGG